MSVIQEEVGVEWRPVEGFPGYSVSRLGQVRRDSSTRVLHTRINQYGVPYVGLMRGVKQCIRSLPLLVASNYIPQPNPHFDTPINRDGNRSNCRVDNLAWRPRWYASAYFVQFVDRYDHPIEQPVREVETDEEFPNSMAAACYYGILEREIVLSILNNTITWVTFQKFAIPD